MIRAVTLTKIYDTVVAISELTLTVGKGRTMGVIGPNGSGKTTLLRMISTLAKPNNGSLSVCGFDALRHPREVRRRISFMPAEASLPLNMTIGEYMRYFACACGVPFRERTGVIGRALQLTDLNGREGVTVRSLSTGNRQRLLLAKTLLPDPELLVLDEPAAGLDPRARIEIRTFLKELGNMGKTIIVSSHILADIESICTDICILEEGKEKLAGTIEDLRNCFASAQKLVRIRVPEEHVKDACARMDRLEQVTACRAEGNVLCITSGSPDCNILLKTLIDADIPVLEMREERPDLEDIFMESTKGVVS
jgi:ABC-2 type transport system ATP-binding protein